MNVSACSDERPTFTAQDRSFAYDVARRIVRDDDAAADVAQDAMLLAYRHRDRFRGDSRYRTWLYRIVAHSALTHLRRRRRIPTELFADQRDEVADVPASAASPEESLATAQAMARARRALDALGAAYGDVLRLRFIDDLSEAEVARALGLSVATVKIRTYRGRHALRARLAA